MWSFHRRSHLGSLLLLGLLFMSVAAGPTVSPDLAKRSDDKAEKKPTGKTTPCYRCSEGSKTAFKIPNGDLSSFAERECPVYNCNGDFCIAGVVDGRFYAGCPDDGPSSTQLFMDALEGYSDKDGEKALVFKCKPKGKGVGDCRDELFKKLHLKKNQRDVHVTKILGKDFKLPVLCDSYENNMTPREDVYDLVPFGFTSVTNQTTCEKRCAAAVCKKDKTDDTLYWVEGCPSDIKKTCNNTDGYMKRFGYNWDHEDAHLCYYNEDIPVRGAFCDLQNCRATLFYCLKRPLYREDPFYSMKEGLVLPTDGIKVCGASEVEKQKEGKLEDNEDGKSMATQHLIILYQILGASFLGYLFAHV